MNKTIFKIAIRDASLIFILLNISFLYSFAQSGTSPSGNFTGQKKIMKINPIGTAVFPDTNNLKLRAKGIPVNQEPRKYPRSAELKLNALSRGDSVILRWAVTTPGGWIVANKDGYIIERYLIDSAEANSEFKILTPVALKPWTLEEWKRNSSQDDKFAAIAAQCLYGKNSIK
ncbi:MAG: hypothetical protein ABSG15_03990, partial [FCB group bacterium]